MSADDWKLPRATLRDNKLYIEGDSDPYYRDFNAQIFFRVRKLKIGRSYKDPERRPVVPSPQDDLGQTKDMDISESMIGSAELELRDRFAVAGLGTSLHRTTDFSLFALPDDDVWPWRVSITFYLSEPDVFLINAHCTQQCFDDLLAALRRGAVESIRVGMETTMWTKDYSTKFGADGDFRRWHVAAPDSEPSTVAGAAGNISHISWVESLDRESKAPPLVELPARVNTMLQILILIGIALLVLTFLRP